MSKRQEMLEKMRAKMAKKLGGAQRDPDEFRAPKVEPGKDRNFYFYILPPIEEEEIFFYQNGYHYINNHYAQCPRILETDTCPLCQEAFHLLEREDDPDVRRSIAKKFLPSKKFALNILFTDDAVNGEFAGKVMWYNAPQTVFKKLQDAFMRDDAGDDPRRPKAFGDFFNPKEAYVFNLRVTEKGGYPNYETSDFLAEAPGEIPNAEEALGKRHVLKSKFPEPDMKELQDFVDRIVHGVMDDEDDDDTPSTSNTTKSETVTESKPETVKTETVKKTEEPKEESKPEAKTETTSTTSDSEMDNDEELDALMAKLKKST